jgi:hypothetical protein
MDSRKVCAFLHRYLQVKVFLFKKKIDQVLIIVFRLKGLSHDIRFVETGFYCLTFCALQNLEIV